MRGFNDLLPPVEWRIYDRLNDQTHTDRGLLPGDQR
jgi:hypothetical protein